jgi:hypothetical protein
MSLPARQAVLDHFFQRCSLGAPELPGKHGAVIHVDIG